MKRHDLNAVQRRMSKVTFLLAVWLISPAWLRAAQLTALDKYVAKPDTNYSFQVVTTNPGDGYTTFVLEMTSQAWLTTNEVDQPGWKH